MSDQIAPVPHGRTARRLSWQHLPPELRAAVERQLGSPVAEAASQDAGFTPGFASVLTCADGSRHFVKAASTAAQRPFADAYREEGRRLASLDASVPAPALRWRIDEDWVVLGIEYVDGRAPQRPWVADELQRALGLLETCTEALTPVPERWRLATFAEELAGWPAHWGRVRRTRTDLPHLDEAAELAAGFAEVTAGDTVVHTEARGDNMLLGERGEAWLCDWNFPVRGAAWIDPVWLLVEAYGDGLDADAHLAGCPLTADVPAEHVDRVLALLAGYLLKSADDRVPPASPHLRRHQAWLGEAAFDWLAARRGWA